MIGRAPSPIRFRCPVTASCALCAMLEASSQDFRNYLLVAEHRGDTMLPRIGILRALYRDEKSPGAARKKPKKHGIV
jgi:hypothetical protein